jgi:expansin (peptidoglycan-binding protein)
LYVALKTYAGTAGTALLLDPDVKDVPLALVAVTVNV